MIKANYHTHTSRCGHAEGQDEEYVAAALEQGFTVLGFSDHTPWPYTSSYRHPNVRMDVTRLPEYVESVRHLQAQYRDRIRIYLGMECEYFPEYMNWLRETREQYHMDYLILGNHYDGTDETGMYFGHVSSVSELRHYIDMTVKGLETGLFAYLAHPDLFMRGKNLTDEDIRGAARDLCAACRRLQVPMEFNLHERYLYPRTHRESYPSWTFFDVVCEENMPVLIGVDAHEPDELRSGEWARAEREFGDYAYLLKELPQLPSEPTTI